MNSAPVNVNKYGVITKVLQCYIDGARSGNQLMAIRRYVQFTLPVVT